MNASKTKTMIVSRSSTIHPQSTPLTLDGTVLKKSADVVRQVFHAQSLFLRSFWSFVLPVLEYCSAVWCSAADSQLKLLDRVVRSANFLAGSVCECNCAHRRSVAVLCIQFNMRNNTMRPLSGALPLPYVPARVTRVLWLPWALVDRKSTRLNSSH